MTKNRSTDLENVLSTFGYHCSVIATQANLNGFGLTAADGTSVYVTMCVEKRAAPDLDMVWDTISVNGVIVGNRCGARDEYARLCAPVIAAAARVTTDTETAFRREFTSHHAAVEFEARVLSVGSEFLPECARLVRDGGDTTPEYWAFLSSQINAE